MKKTNKDNAYNVPLNKAAEIHMLTLFYQISFVAHGVQHAADCERIYYIPFKKSRRAAEELCALYLSGFEFVCYSARTWGVFCDLFDFCDGNYDYGILWRENSDDRYFSFGCYRKSDQCSVLH